MVATTRISQESSDCAEEDTLNPDDSVVESNSASPSNDVDISKTLPDVVEQNFAAALPKLEHFAHVPGTKIDEFLEELHYLLCSATFPLFVNIIEAVLQKHASTTDKSVIKEVSTALSASHLFLNAIENGDCLSTSYLRNKFYKENFNVIESVEYMLDERQKNSFQYMPILKSLQKFFNR